VGGLGELRSTGRAGVHGELENPEPIGVDLAESVAGLALVSKITEVHNAHLSTHNLHAQSASCAVASQPSPALGRRGAAPAVAARPDDQNEGADDAQAAVSLRHHRGRMGADRAAAARPGLPETTRRAPRRSTRGGDRRRDPPASEASGSSSATGTHSANPVVVSSFTIWGRGRSTSSSPPAARMRLPQPDQHIDPHRIAGDLRHLQGNTRRIGQRDQPVDLIEQPRSSGQVLLSSHRDHPTCTTPPSSV
jgi:hypothetical protein